MNVKESDSRAYKLWCQHPPESVGGHHLQWTEGNLKKLYTALPCIKWLLPCPNYTKPPSLFSLLLGRCNEVVPVNGERDKFSGGFIYFLEDLCHFNSAGRMGLDCIRFGSHIAPTTCHFRAGIDEFKLRNFGSGRSILVNLSLIFAVA